MSLQTFMTSVCHNILLFGIDGTQTLPIARALHNSGYRLTGLYHDEYGYGTHSRYISEKIRLNSTDDDQLLRDIIDIIKEKSIDTIIPFGDSSADFLSRYRETLFKHVTLTIPPHDIFMAGYDKNRLMTICREKGYPHPLTLDLSVSHDESVLRDFPYPALIKPNITTGGRGMTLVRDYEELSDKLADIVRVYGACHLQQFIPEGGRQFKVQIFVDRRNDRKIGSVIWKQRYYPEKGGSSCCNITVDRPDLIDMCGKILDDLTWEGFADFDLIEDPRNSELKIMEINPRFPACLRSSIESGIDYANILVDYTFGHPLREYEYKPGAKLRHIGFEILWFLSSKNRFTTKPNWFNWFSPRTSFQDFSWDDPLPFIYGTWGNIRKILTSDIIKQKKGI